MSHQTWSADEGAPISGVHQILQAADGYLWLATESGVLRFDGESFVRFRHETQPAIPGDDITAIAQDAFGNLWVGSPDGLTEFRNGGWHRVNGVSGVHALAVTNDNSLLVLTDGGLLRLNADRLVPFEGAPAGITSMQTAPDGTMLVSAESGVFRVNRREIKVQPLHFLSRGSLAGIANTGGGALWAHSAGAVFYDNAGIKREFHTGRELPLGRVTSLLIDRYGRAWIGMSRGLFAIGSGRNAIPVEVPALHGESVAALFEDREGNIWIGTESSGLHVLRPRVFRSASAAAGEGVTAGVMASDGTVWLGTREEGLHTATAAGLQTRVAPDQLTSRFILSLARGPRGDIWAGTPDGLNHIQGKRVTTITAATGLPDDFVRSIVVDTRGVVWAGTRGGLAKFDGAAWTTMTSADGLGSDSIGPLLDTSRPTQSGPDLWVGTAAGLSHILRNRIESFSPHLIAGQAIVTALAPDSGSGLWVGTHGAGLSHFENGTFDPLTVRGLPNEIVAILRDKRGDLWLRGDRGVYRVAERDLLTCARKPATACAASVVAYSTVDGLPNDTLAAEGTSSAWTSNDGQLWFGTKTGVAVADPAQMTWNALPPPVVIERLQVDDVGLPLTSTETRVQPGHNRYVFDFAALSFTAPSKNRYRYMLEGFDKDWIEAGAAHTAVYTNLPARQFTFRVQASNNDGVWNRQGAKVLLRVLPPFYRRWWFYLLALAVLSASAFGTYRLRVLSIERRFNLVLSERNRVAREVHDTLAQDFVSVSLQIDLASALLKSRQVDAAQTQLQETRKLVKDGLEEARQSIWNLRANTAADSLPARLTALTKRYAQASFRVRLKMGGAYHRVSAHVESEVFRIAQESLSNVERHSNATEAGIELHYEPHALRLNVRDNGAGFLVEEALAKQGHYGVKGMRERGAALGGEFTITSEPGAGTQVTLLVSLPEREGAKT